MLSLLLTAALLQGLSSPGAPVNDLQNTESLRNRYEDRLTKDAADQAAQAGEVEVSERLALKARAAHDMNRALGELLRGGKMVPGSPRLLYDIGVLEEQIGLYHDADAVVEELRRMNPNDAKVLYLASRIELDLSRLTDAERDMRGYLQAHAEDATAHYGLGRILQQAQQASAAKSEFERSIELQPAQTEAFYQLAQLALEAGDFQTAIADNAQVLARAPRHGGALTGTGMAYYKTKQYAAAEQVLMRAVTDAPEYQLGHYYYGLVLGRLGKKEEATRELALAAKMADDTNRKEAQRLRLNP